TRPTSTSHREALSLCRSHPPTSVEADRDDRRISCETLPTQLKSRRLPPRLFDSQPSDHACCTSASCRPAFRLWDKRPARLPCRDDLINATARCCCLSTRSRVRVDRLPCRLQVCSYLFLFTFP